VIAYVNRDEWYPWFDIGQDKAYSDLEIEIDETEYNELMALQVQAHLFQERMGKLYTQGKKHD